MIYKIKSLSARTSLNHYFKYYIKLLYYHKVRIFLSMLMFNKKIVTNLRKTPHCCLRIVHVKTLWRHPVNICTCRSRTRVLSTCDVSWTASTANPATSRSQSPGTRCRNSWVYILFWNTVLSKRVYLHIFKPANQKMERINSK